MMKIYADNAATTKMSGVALEAMLPYMTEHYGNPSSLYTIGQEAKEGLEAARAAVASCIGAQPREITFTSGGSEADNQAIRTAACYRRAQGQEAHHLDQVRASRGACIRSRSSRKRASR